MSYESIFLAIILAVFLFTAKRERKLRIAANGISGFICLLLFNIFLPVKTGFGIFSVGMALILGVPAVIAMTVVKLL